MTQINIRPKSERRVRVRKGEEIGGGWFVFRRGDSTNRIRPGFLPFEHPDQASAVQEAARLASNMPGYTFDILNVVASIKETPDEITDDFLGSDESAFSVAAE